MSHRPWTALAGMFLILGAILVAPLWGAVLGGTIKSVNPEKGIIVVELRSGAQKTFTVPKSADVLVDGKKTPLDKLVPGQAISITTTQSGAVTKVSARGGDAVAKPEEKKPEEKPDPKPNSKKPVAENTDDSKPEKPVARTPSRGGSRRPSSGDETADWPQYGGPNRDNRSPDTGLLDEWDNDGPERLWTAQGLGEGFSSVSVADGVIYTMGTRGREEAVFALSLKDGKTLWGVPTGGGVFNDGNGNGPRSTPTVDGDLVYALGAQGDLVCLSKSDGRRRWSKNILQEFRADNIPWGICESALIDGNQLIVTPGGQQATMAALNKMNGNVLWTCKAPGNPRPAYSSAIIVEAAGVRQYVNFTHSNVIGVSASGGNFLWANARAANGTANCSSPVTDGDMVFASSGYNQGGACVKLSRAGRGIDAELLYHTDEMKSHHGGMVVLDGYVYGTNESILTCLDMKSGKVAWKNRSVGKGAVIYADGHLYVRSEDGPIALVEATPDGYREKGRFRQPDQSGRKTWAHPVVTGGKLFLRDQDKLLAFNVAKGK